MQTTEPTHQNHWDDQEAAIEEAKARTWESENPQDFGWAVVREGGRFVVMWLNYFQMEMAREDDELIFPAAA